MKNIFAKFQEYVKKPKRNVFDLQFRNNLTTKFGQLTPVFCKEVVPGDSFKIDTKFGLMLMPMKFPVQTPMKAYVHYFYVRNRTLWKDWMDFIGGTKEGLVQPYVQPVDTKKFFRVGGLSDYLGVPNVIYSGESIQSDSIDLSSNYFPANDLESYTAADMIYTTISGINNDKNVALVGSFGSVALPSIIPALPIVQPDGIVRGAPPVDFDYAGNYSLDEMPNVFDENSGFGELIGANIDECVLNFQPNGLGTNATLFQALFDETSSNNYCFATKLFESNSINLPTKYKLSIRFSRSYLIGKYLPVYFTTGGLHSENITTNPFIRVALGGGNATLPETTEKRLYIVFFNSTDRLVKGYSQVDVTMNLVEEEYYRTYVGEIDNPSSIDVTGADRFAIFTHMPVRFGATTRDSQNYSSLWSPVDSYSLEVVMGNNYVTSISDLESSPYDSEIHLNALPFRAYEAIYNAYYRNPQNNPFVLDGVPEYNRYNTTYEGGADTTQYDLYFRNWEYDFLTSAVQSPQQGVAPLVGVSVTGEATFADEEGNTYYAQALMNDDGEITGWQSHSSNMPVGSLRLLMDMANTGISINDLRNVNAFQRFLENNIRHGLKYKDQLMSHFGVKARYDELDMPEFIGGCSAEMEVYKVTQTSNSGDTPLGSFVGQAQVKKDYGHSVTHYCDEHGFIMGIMSIVPVPVYSQLLPKFFVKNTQLDYFFPEFGHIGYQPILQKEVSPLQTYYSGLDLNKVFGYNRAWYDYLASTDEVHAQFRTTMRDFIMNRSFSSEPELGEDFLLVDPEQLNDVFLAGTEGDDLYAPEADKIIGSLLFNVSAKRPIPLFGIPKLDV